MMHKFWRKKGAKFDDRFRRLDHRDHRAAWKFPLESLKMVRTKADGGGRKAVAAKAPRKQVGGGSSDSGGSMMSPSKNSGCAGGNPIRWWPTPDWQKGVGDFFPKIDNNKKSSQTLENSSSESSSSNASSDQPGVSDKELGIEKLESDN